jgi:hypothetical protein
MSKLRTDKFTSKPVFDTNIKQNPGKLKTRSIEEINNKTLKIVHNIA